MAKKRSNNEGTISKRQDGRWEARLIVDGKRRCVYGKTQREAMAKLSELKKAASDGRTIVPARLTVGRFLDDWLENTVKPSTRPRTYESYELTVRLHLMPELGRVPLTSLNPSQVQQLVNKKLSEGLSPRSAEYVKCVLSRALNRAVKWGMLPRNVAALAVGPKVERHSIQTLSPDQARVFLKSLEGSRLEALFSVALAIGLRRGEALGLQWTNIDLESGSLFVESQLQRIGSRLVLGPPKSVSAKRMIPLPQFAIDHLKKHKETQALERLDAGDKWTESDFVFTTDKGKPLDPRNLVRTLHHALKKAELTSLRFHDLRHTCASLLLAQNVHPRVVMEILGHSQISLTMNTYSHVLPSVKSEASKLMNELLQ